MNILKRMLTCMVAAALLMAMIPTAALAGYTAIVNTSSAKVYEKASGGDSAKLKKGIIVTVKSVSGGIAKIKYNGKTGYVKESALKKLTETKVGVSGANIYEKASRSSKSSSISKGTEVNVISTKGDWAMVERKGNIGYIKKCALYAYGATGTGEPADKNSDKKNEKDKEKKTEEKKVDNSEKIEKVIDAAKDKLGCKYVHGTQGPNTFDCSGFTQYAYRKIGIYLSGSAEKQGYGKGKKVSYSQLKRGDIVCFDTVADDGDASDHVGIYLGSGKFIHASSSGGKVMISSLSGGFYRRAFSWGRRIL